MSLWNRILNWFDPPKPEPVKPQNLDDLKKTRLDLLITHNNERSNRGIPTLILDEGLNIYAQKHAEWMATRNRLVHSTISNLLNDYRATAENIAWNQQSVDEVVRGWMLSSGHRHNILNVGYVLVGFGVAKTENGETYWCAVFGV